MKTHWKYYSSWRYIPFKDDESLHNICNGVNAGDTVNVDNANDIGQNILGSMTGQSTISYSFKKKDKAVTLGAKNSVKIAGEEIDIDPMFLFQHLITGGERTNDFPLLFKYELSSYPTSLYKSNCVLLVAQKHTLAEALMVEQGNTIPPVIDENIHYILDGGALIHRLPWKVGQTYNDIVHMHTS